MFLQNIKYSFYITILIRVFSKVLKLRNFISSYHSIKWIFNNIFLSTSVLQNNIKNIKNIDNIYAILTNTKKIKNLIIYLSFPLDAIERSKPIGTTCQKFNCISTQRRTMWIDNSTPSTKSRFWSHSSNKNWENI